MNCRFCKKELSVNFCDLQTCPPSNAMINQDKLNCPEIYLPLKVFVCDNCWLVQVDEIEKAESIFNNEYTYFSSYSITWLEHARNYTNMIIKKLNLNESSHVVEIASNDGYLLQYFLKYNIPVLGIEPTENTAKVAIDKGIPTIIDFFNSTLAQNQLKSKADLLIGNNVLAHVPDIIDFIKGIKLTLKPEGIGTFEFPHLCKLIEENQFDTIYHEHFSYFSLTTISSIFESQGLIIFDVEQLSTHGGSLRIYVRHIENEKKIVSNSVIQLLNEENKLGVNTLNYYLNFQKRVDEIKYDFISFLLSAKKDKKRVIGYGAAAKGNTLLNYCGIKGNDLIAFVVDASPYKQGKYLPGSRIPVKNKDEIKKYNPDYIIIFPWNIKTEIINSLKEFLNKEVKFVTAIPKLKIE